jgi:hypothetical protein
MDAFLIEVTRIRKEAQESPFWNLNIDALLESNNECFEGPILRADIEACYNFVMDQYDTHIRIKEGILEPPHFEEYLAIHKEGNPFFSLIELDEQKNVIDVTLVDTVDCELVGEFLSEKYKWKDS